MEAKENYVLAESEAFNAGTFPYLSLATNIQPSTAFDPGLRKIFYSKCYWSDGLNATNDTGFRVWTGIIGFNNGAAYSPGNYNNFSIMSVDIDSDDVTEYDAYDPDSTVPNGIGGSNGTARRYVEADALEPQGIKIVDPRTGNVWSHHTAGGTRSCVIYEFRAQDDYALTISPYVPGGDRHLELFGISANWVVIGDFQKNTANRYTLECLPRLRQTDEVTADYLLSYAAFQMPSTFDGAANAPIRNCIDADGNFWFAGAERGSGARDYRLAKFVPPAAVANPGVGGSVTDITPWTSSDGPNTDAAPYTRSSTATVLNNFILRNQISVYALHATDELVFINRLYPEQIGPSGSADRALLFFQATYIDMGDLSYDFVGSFITGYMTAAWVMTDDPNAAAYAVYDMRESDLYRDYNGYNYSGEGIDHTLRWFDVVVRPVSGGVIGDTTTTRIVKAQYRFVSGEVPALTRFIDETNSWDPRYPDYAVAISDDDIIYFTTGQNTSGAVILLNDSILTDVATSSFWSSGLTPDDDGAFNRFTEYFLNREGEQVTQPFMKLSFSRNRGVCRIRYGDIPR